MILLTATPLSYDHDAVRRRRGIWSSEGLAWLPSGARRSASVELDGAEGQRLAGLIEIGATTMFDAVDFVRTDTTSCLTIEPAADLTEDRVRALAQTILTAAAPGEVDWGRAIERAARMDAVCFRVFGNFDDREVGIDAFLPAASLATLGEDVV